MAMRKLLEAQALLQLSSAPAELPPSQPEDASGDSTEGDGSNGDGSNGGEGVEGAVSAGVVPDAAADAQTRLLTTEAELARCRHERDSLRGELRRLRASVPSPMVSAPHAAGLPAPPALTAGMPRALPAEAPSAGGSATGSSSFAAQIESLTSELRKSKIDAAQALAEKVALGRELAEQQRLQRKAKIQRIAEQEKVTALEVKLAKARENRHRAHQGGRWHPFGGGGETASAAVSEEEEHTRALLQAQSEQILHLVGEKEELQAKLSAAEAKLI